MYLDTEKIPAKSPGVGSATLGCCVAQTTSKCGKCSAAVQNIDRRTTQGSSWGSELCVGADSSLAGPSRDIWHLVGVGFRPRRQCRRRCVCRPRSQRDIHGTKKCNILLVLLHVRKMKAMLKLHLVPLPPFPRSGTSKRCAENKRSRTSVTLTPPSDGLAAATFTNYTLRRFALQARVRRSAWRFAEWSGMG